MLVMEVEYMIVLLDHVEKNAKLSLRQKEVMASLRSTSGQHLSQSESVLLLNGPSTKN